MMRDRHKKDTTARDEVLGEFGSRSHDANATYIASGLALLIIEQRRTNDLLEKLLTAANGSGTKPVN